MAFILICRGGLTQVRKMDKGIYRAILDRKDGQMIVFNFEVLDSAGKKIIYIHNAAERLLVDEISYSKDSVFIHLPFFESEFRLAYAGGNEWKGNWLKRLEKNYQVMPIRIFYNEQERFNGSNKASEQVNGRWAIKFLKPNEEAEEMVGEFVQIGSKVTGTVLTTTGDDRYLDGIVDGDSLRLSTFDGGHALLFTACIKEDSLTGGQYFSGPRGHISWIGSRNNGASLPDDFSITKMRSGQNRLHFSFTDADGHKVSITDPRYKNKVVLVQIMGSWCPNCMDETRFLSSLFKEYRNKGVEIIGVAYERSTDFERSRKSLRSFQQRFDVQYPLLITGVSVNDSLRAKKTLPELADIVGFPTTIFVNKKGEVEKIHTGFNGPGSGANYAEQQKEFYDIVNQLLSE